MGNVWVFLNRAVNNFSSRWGYTKKAGIRVAVVKSTCWFYIKVTGDIPQNTRGKSPAPGS